VNAKAGGRVTVALHSRRLHLAASQGYTVRDLCGPFVRVIDSKIYLVHQTAKEFGHEATAVRLTVDKGADVNAKDENGLTALCWADVSGNEAVAQLLVGKGAGVSE
jgi:Ankyrin repeats (many copies)